FVAPSRPRRAPPLSPPRRSSDLTAAVDRTATLLTELGHEVRPIELGIDITESMAIGGRIMMAQLVATVDARLGALGRELADADLEPWTRTLVDNGGTGTRTQPHRAR